MRYPKNLPTIVTVAPKRSGFHTNHSLPVADVKINLTKSFTIVTQANIVLFTNNSSFCIRPEIRGPLEQLLTEIKGPKFNLMIEITKLDTQYFVSIRGDRAKSVPIEGKNLQVSIEKLIYLL